MHSLLFYEDSAQGIPPLIVPSAQGIIKEGFKALEYGTRKAKIAILDQTEHSRNELWFALQQVGLDVRLQSTKLFWLKLKLGPNTSSRIGNRYRACEIKPKATSCLAK